MTHIIAVRHGESIGNVENRFHGHYPSDLTEKGHAQAECSAEYLKNTPIAAVYASDLPRAVSTAKHIADKHGLPVFIDKQLREWYGGVWENMLLTDIVKDYPEDYHRWQIDLAHCRAPEGESMPELRERIAAAIARIAAAHDGETVVVVSHAAALRSVSTVFAGVEPEKIVDFPYPPNVSLTYVDYEKDGSCRLIEYGAAEHLVAAGIFTKLDLK